MASAELTAAEYRALAAFRYELRRFLRVSGRAARAAGLDVQHHEILVALRGMPQHLRATTGVLAERLQIEHHDAVALVRRLESDDFVRARAADDRRNIAVQLTARGEALLGVLAVFHRAELPSIAPVLSRALGALGTSERWPRRHLGR